MRYGKNRLLALFLVLLGALVMITVMNWIIKIIGALDRERIANAQKRER